MDNIVAKKFLMAFERAPHFSCEDPYDTDYDNDEFDDFDNDTEFLCWSDYILGEVRTSHPQIIYNDNVYFVKELTDNNDEYHIHIKEYKDWDTLRGYLTAYDLLEYFDINNGWFEDFQLSIIEDDGSLTFITNKEFKVYVG